MASQLLQVSSSRELYFLQVGDVIMEFGPDLETSCGNPGHILSVNTTYVVGVGGPCSVYNEWTAYNDFSSDDLQLLTNNCTMESSATITPLPSVVTLLLLTLMSSIDIMIML